MKGVFHCLWLPTRQRTATTNTLSQHKTLAQPLSWDLGQKQRVDSVKCYSCLWAGNLGQRDWAQDPWQGEYGEFGSGGRKQSLSCEEKENRKKWAGRKIRDSGHTQCLTDRGVSFPQREMGRCCQGARTAGWWTYAQLLVSQGAWTHFALSQRERKAVAEVMLPWKHRKKQSKRPLLCEICYSLFQGVGQRNAALLYLHSSAAVSVVFQEYSEPDKDLLGSFPALFTTVSWEILCFLITLFICHLGIYLSTYYAHSKQLWAIELNEPWGLLRALTFIKPHTEPFTGVKSHFDRNMKGLMALFHHT